jgi:hypothetical protein
MKEGSLIRWSGSLSRTTKGNLRLCSDPKLKLVLCLSGLMFCSRSFYQGEFVIVMREAIGLQEVL